MIKLALLSSRYNRVITPYSIIMDRWLSVDGRRFHNSFGLRGSFSRVAFSGMIDASSLFRRHKK